MKSIYDLAMERMNPEDIDHHESDLYLRKNKISEQLVAQYEYKNHVIQFIDELDKDWWYELPFAYDPYWLSVFLDAAKYL